MSDLESRLTELGSRLVPSEGAAPPLGPLLAAAARRRMVRRRALVGGVMVTVLLAAGGATALAPSARSARESRVAADDGSPTTVASEPTTTSSTGTTPTTAPPSTDPSGLPADTTIPSPSREATAPGKGDSATTTTTGPPSSSVGLGPGLWVVGLDGSGLRQLSSDGGPMSWSPDGREIAKAAMDRIGVFDSTGSGQARTIDVEGEWAVCLDWSARGDLAWVTSAGQLRISRDGRTSRQLPGQYPSNVGTGSCRWSPDGALLAIGRDELFIVNGEGELIRRVEGGRAGSAVWSPDGSRLGFLRTDQQAQLSIVVLEPLQSGGGETVIRPPENSSNPYSHGISWSVDGRSLYIQSGRKAFKLNTATEEMTPMSTADGCCRLLTELADGSFVAFSPSPVQEEGERKVLTIATQDFGTTRTLARLRGPRPDAPVMSECRGPYLSDKRLAPAGREIAFIALGGYGPRCDSPIF